MRYFSFDITGASQSAIKNEIYFNIASARANEYEFVVFNFKCNNSEKAKAVAIRILKGMNLDGRVKLFIQASSFDGVNKEELYFRNKYPAMREICQANREAIIVKI